MNIVLRQGTLEENGVVVFVEGDLLCLFIHLYNFVLGGEKSGIWFWPC